MPRHPTITAVYPVRAQLAWLWLVLGLFVGGLQLSAAESSRNVRVVVPSDYYPYSYYGPKNEVLGFSNDLLDAVAKAMDLRIDRTVLPTAENQAALESGRADVMLLYSSVLGVDPDVMASVPYLTLQGVAFVRQGDRRFGGLAEMREGGARVVAGPVGAQYLFTHGFSADRVQQESMDEALRKLSRGEADVAFVTRHSGMAQAQRLGLTNIVALEYPLKGYVVRFSFATRPGDGDLLAQLNEGLSILLQNGEFERIREKWFAVYDPPRIAWHEMIPYVAGLLALALSVAVWALYRWRHLNDRISAQAEQITESNSILAEAQHFARLGHWKHSTDSGGRIVWSEETFHIFERDRRHGPMGISELSACVVATDRVRWNEAMVQLESQGCPFELDVVIQPRQGLRKTVHWRGRPVFDSLGRRVGSFGTVQDVSERRAAEEALRQSERLLRVLYENLPLGLGVVERTETGWRMSALNPEAARQLHLSSSKADGLSLGSLGMGHDDQVFWQELFDQCLRQADPLRLERTHDGGRRVQALTLVSIGAAGLHPKVCFIVEDVSERRHKDAEIEQGRRLRAIGELVGGIAHEFNNLLTPILLSIDRMQGKWGHLPGLSDEVRMVSEAARRSSDLTRRLLTFGRKAERKVEVLDMHEVVQANVELLRHAVDRRIRFDVERLRGLPRIEACGNDLHQVFMNLFLNARDALAPKLATGVAIQEGWSACIRVSGSVCPPDVCSPADPQKAMPVMGWLRITIHDNGCGMPAGVVERIFEPFFTTKPVGKGTGLGLATVWHLVSEMGGRMDVESVEAEGTSFHLFIPMRAGGVHEPLDAKPVVFQSLPTPQSLRFLVVEDEQPILELIQFLLEKDGHTVTCAGNGRDGLEKLLAQPGQFDMMLMDLNMPEMSGLELARQARENRISVPILVMSGRVSEDEASVLGQLGISGIPNKPFNSEALRNSIRGVLASK